MTDDGWPREAPGSWTCGLCEGSEHDRERDSMSVRDEMQLCKSGKEDGEFDIRTVAIISIKIGCG
ncbi:hypothetical protein SESBI_22749 [Sesbania bispinosa]|nr:hypothetical protein SESBI_22749 [Sesbania bispinosa]